MNENEIDNQTRCLNLMFSVHKQIGIHNTILNDLKNQAQELKFKLSKELLIELVSTYDSELSVVDIGSITRSLWGPSTTSKAIEYVFWLVAEQKFFVTDTMKLSIDPKWADWKET